MVASWQPIPVYSFFSLQFPYFDFRYLSNLNWFHVDRSEDTADDILRQFKEASTFSLRKSCKCKLLFCVNDDICVRVNKNWIFFFVSICSWFSTRSSIPTIEQKSTIFRWVIISNHRIRAQTWIDNCQLTFSLLSVHSGYSETSSPPMKKYSINNHLVSRESTSSHSSRESLNQFQSHLNNGGGHFMDEALATDQFYQTPRSYVPVPPLQPIQRPTYQVVQRQLPGLIKADHPVNGSYNHGHGHGPGYGHNNTQHQQQQQRHAMNGSIFNRQKLSQVPELYAIRPTQSRYNGDHYASTTQQEYPSTANNQQMPQPMYHNNHSAPQRSLRQNVNDLLRENVSLASPRVRIWANMKLNVFFSFRFQIRVYTIRNRWPRISHPIEKCWTCCRFRSPNVSLHLYHP